LYIIYTWKTESQNGRGWKGPLWVMEEARGVSMVAQAGGQLQREGRQLRREGISIHPPPGASR